MAGAEILDLTDVEVDKALRKYSAHKQWLRTFLTKATNINDLLDGVRSRQSEQELSETLDKCETQLNYLCQISHYLTQCKFEREKEHAEETETLEKSVNTLRRKVNGRRIALDSNQMTFPVPPTPSSTIRPVTDLKPQQLALTVQASEFRTWQRQFRAYYSASNMAAAKLVDQQAYLLTCLDSELAKRIIRDSSPTTPVIDGMDGMVTCMSLLGSYFQAKYPILLRRKQFFSYTQQAGQSERDYIEELHSRADEADLANMNMEDMLCLMYVSGLTDSRLRERMSEVEQPTLAVFNNLVDLHMHAKATAGTEARALATGGRQGKQGNQQKERKKKEISEKEKMRRKAMKGKCFRCGNGTHMIPECKQKSDVKCNKCGDVGHMASACMTTAAAQVTTHPEQSAVAQDYPPLPALPALSYEDQAHVRHTQFNQQTPEMPL